ncbi:hypothetical protein Ate01nite_40050 [Actinoplanes teichomyceticus]|nr:hypothetical protein Ate01nite_40050 [Actinoplanes teichomyceticus]
MFVEQGDGGQRLVDGGSRAPLGQQVPTPGGDGGLGPDRAGERVRMGAGLPGQPRQVGVQVPAVRPLGMRRQRRPVPVPLGRGERRGSGVRTGVEGDDIGSHAPGHTAAVTAGLLVAAVRRRSRPAGQDRPGDVTLRLPGPTFLLR